MNDFTVVNSKYYVEMIIDYSKKWRLEDKEKRFSVLLLL